MNQMYAHSKPNAPKEQWQTLQDHSNGVATLASSFAAAFNSSSWGRLLGLLHDLGKSRQSFQRYLDVCNGLDDASYDSMEHNHSGTGACWACKNLGGRGRILAYCIAGHHAGIPDWSGGDTPLGSLVYRLADESLESRSLDEAPVREWIGRCESEWNDIKLSLPWPFKRNPECSPDEFQGSDLSFWIRMLFSCLVDADYLDTERFIDRERNLERDGWPSLKILNDMFFSRMDEMQASSERTPVNQIRAEIRSACESCAENHQGIFSLTVPTGGGKTLSSMAFAFRHAMKFSKKRIIYVVPYTSIIEQTADTLRRFLGKDAVLEHHSNLDPERETQRSRLASENWDAPVVVTTTVQFFESLYACKSSRCRKIHNIADSVVIVDEVQLLPTHLLLPCVEAINQLACHYGTTIVLSTATQPDLPGLPQTSITEIIPNELNLYKRLKRTEISFPTDIHQRMEWKDVADELCEYEQVLCVVNTRKDCRDLYECMPKGTIHLSALMCGEHRLRVIADIKAKLCEKAPIRVISTQLVEAGVDIDFPVVYRAFTGLSSIVQSAGRCNREGRLETNGKVVVFVPPKPSPRGELLKSEQTMFEIIASAGSVDTDDASIYPTYFKALYGRMNELGANLRRYLVEGSGDVQFKFRVAASNFRIIDDQDAATVIVRYGESGQLIDELLASGPSRVLLRRLQRYTVRIPRRRVREFMGCGIVQSVGAEDSGLYVQTLPSFYDDTFGVDMEHTGFLVEDLML